MTRKTDQNAQWILDSEELAFIQAKKSSSPLAFALMLKFFQFENRYPAGADIQNLSPEIITDLSNQLCVSQQNIDQFDWVGRSSERFRKAIRDFLGFRKPTVSDGDKLIQWLMKNHLSAVPTLSQCRVFAITYLRRKKIESFSTNELDRYIHAARAKFEKTFFATIVSELKDITLKKFDELLTDEKDDEISHESDEISSNDKASNSESIKLYDLKKDIGEARLKNIEFTVKKIDCLKSMNLPHQALKTLKTFPRKLLLKYYRRIMAEHPSHIQEHDSVRKAAMMTVFCSARSQMLTDGSADLLLQLIHKLKTVSEASIKNRIISEVTCVNGKFDILCKLSSIASEKPKGVIEKEIYPAVSQDTLANLSSELKSRGKWYQTELYNKMRSLYAHGHRRLLLLLLDIFDFRVENAKDQPLLDAILFIKENQNNEKAYEKDIQKIPMQHLIQTDSRAIIKEYATDHTVKYDQKPQTTVDHMRYEVMVLEALHDKLKCKSLWIEGSYRYRNPCDDMPSDFDDNPEYYFKLLGLPMDEKEFTTQLQQELFESMDMLNESMPHNSKVKIVPYKNGARFKVSPSEKQAEPVNLSLLQKEIQLRWMSINLIDILKEAELRIRFSKHCTSTSRFQKISDDELQKRILLCFYAIGSNIGIKRASIANAFATESDLRYTKRRHMTVDGVRDAIVEVVDATLAIRDPLIWGTATTGVACDSKHINCWDQNLLTNWHGRYRKRGVMVYWHIDKKSLCIYAQLKTCITSEVGSMLTGILKHCTKMKLDKTYVDTHGQSTIGFGFSYCLNVDLLPRFKAINKQKLFVGDAKDKKRFANLESVIVGTIDWKKIKKSYREVVKHVAALKTGTVDADVLIKRFGAKNEDHPVYQALFEIGKAAKTIFLCRNFAYEELRIEIHEALNVVERVNGIMHFIFYGKLGEIASNDTDDLELSIVCLHLLQACLVYINTLMIQQVLSEPKWKDKLTNEDKRALTPLLHGHINPYGLVSLNMAERLAIELFQKPEKQASVDEIEEFEALETES